jgi:hypothetical protein
MCPVTHNARDADQKEKMEQESAIIGSTNFTFIWDPNGSLYLAGLTCATIQTLSSLVVSIGSHSAARGETPETFADLIRFIPELDRCPGPLPSLIYISPPPGPPRTDEWAQEWRDKRTHGRLQYYCKVVRDHIFASTHWKLVDAQMLLQPYIFHPLYSDFAHYLGSDGQEAVLDDMIAKMGICGESEVDVPGPVIEARL